MTYSIASQTFHNQQVMKLVPFLYMDSQGKVMIVLYYYTSTYYKKEILYLCIMNFA